MFNWDQAAPVAGIPVDGFSVRWTGQLKPRFSQTYTFSTVSDDGVRLCVNNQLLVDSWTDHGTTTNTGTIALTAGTRYDVRMEYFDSGGGAVAPGGQRAGGHHLQPGDAAAGYHLLLARGRTKRGR